MKLHIKENSINYTCTVVKIEHLFPIENADNIQRCSIFGNDIVVSKDLTLGSIMLYFVAGTKLNPDYCKYNNLYSDNTLNADIEKKKGYINSKGRVSAIKLRNVISNGILMPLDSLTCLGIDISKLKVNDSFTDIDNISICEKYIVISKENEHIPKSKVKNVKKFNRLIDGYFHFHNDTEQLSRNIHKLNPNDIIGIHYKKHGCVSSDTVISTLEFGDLTIKYIVDNKIDCHIKAYDIIKEKIVYTKIDQYYFKENHGEWYEIELENGIKLKITSNNPVWLPNLKCYKKVKNLKEGDILMVN